MAKNIEDTKLEMVVGGSLYLDGVSTFDKCKHDNRYRTGGSREDSRFIFFSQHQYQYFCADCKKMFWKDEPY